MARVPPGSSGSRSVYLNPARTLGQQRQWPTLTKEAPSLSERLALTAADGLGRRYHSSVPPPNRSVPSLCIISHLSFLLHACQPRNSNPESQLGHSETHARTSASHPKEKSQTGRVYVSALQIHWPSHAGAHTPARLPTCSGSKGHAFGAGRGDNASDVDKQAAVKVAGCKSGLLSSGV